VHTHILQLVRVSLHSVKSRGIFYAHARLHTHRGGCFVGSQPLAGPPCLRTRLRTPCGRNRLRITEWPPASGSRCFASCPGWPPKLGWHSWWFFAGLLGRVAGSGFVQPVGHCWAATGHETSSCTEKWGRWSPLARIPKAALGFQAWAGGGFQGVEFHGRLLMTLAIALPPRESADWGFEAQPCRAR